MTTRTFTIPLDWFELTQLTVLRLVNAGLGGTLSSLLENLSNLNELDLSLNHFSGSLPSELMLLSNLRELFLDRNSFTGTVPTEVRYFYLASGCVLLVCSF